MGLVYDIQMDRSVCKSISRLAMFTYVSTILKKHCWLQKTEPDQVMQRAATSLV